MKQYILRETDYTLSRLCMVSSEKYKNKTAFSMINNGQIGNSVTYVQMGLLARKFADYLKQAGIRKGEKVILLSENCPQWPLAYFGIAMAGAVSVPLLTGFSTAQIQNIINHCEARAICINANLAGKFQSEEKNPFNSIPLIIIDNLKKDDNFNTESITLNDYNEQKPDDLATIIYTSGTIGSSKGVMLSSRNIITSAVSSYKFIKTNTHDRLLSVLPLAHSYECGLGLLAPLMRGSCITYIDRPPSPSVLLPAFKLLRPTAMITVPLLMDKIYNNSIAPKLKNNKLYKFLLTRSIAMRIAGRKLISVMGGKLKFLGIGGASLSPETEKFLKGAKFPYSAGYGLTEAAPLVAGNKPLRIINKNGYKAADGVKIRIERCPENKDLRDGEIQITGANVMMGYYNDEQKTGEAMTSDKWLRTGDLGSIDKKGRLHIKGRLKALILGPSGENIYPEEIEGLLGSSSLVEESLVYSGKKGELVALVRLSEAAKNIFYNGVSRAAENALEELRTFVNKKLAVFSRLNRIEIKYEPFEKTPTMKIKRYLYV